jgi:hypothetical protein
MDSEYIPPQGAAPEPPVGEAAVPLDAAAVVEQVRELLFGDHRRAAEASVKSLEDRLAALTATVEARFADFERRLAEARDAADHASAGHIEAIGGALHELGDRIKGLIAKPSE